MLRERPQWWPHFTGTLRSTAVTARLGRAVGIAVAILFVTGLLSHNQYQPWSWLPSPATPVRGYRVTQGVHVAAGTATIPLLLVKLWSVYPNLFRFPPVKSIKNAIERISVALLVSSALVQVSTGFLNVLNWGADQRRREPVVSSSVRDPVRAARTAPPDRPARAGRSRWRRRRARPAAAAQLRPATGA